MEINPQSNNIEPSLFKKQKLLWSIAGVLFLVVIGVSGYLYKLKKETAMLFKNPCWIVADQNIKNTNTGEIKVLPGSCPAPIIPLGWVAVVDDVKMVPTEDWKTYTNTQYGFELKYPPDWEVKRENEMMCDAEPPCLEEEAVDIEPNLQTSDYYLANEYYEINTGMWLSVSTDTSGGSCMGEHDWKINNYSEDNITMSKRICTKKFSIDMEIFDDTPHKELYKQTLDQILSTFKFTK